MLSLVESIIVIFLLKLIIARAIYAKINHAFRVRMRGDVTDALALLRGSRPVTWYHLTLAR